MRILIVEDDIGIAKLISTVVSELKFDYSAVYNGKDALDSIANDSFELVLLDYSLPDMTAEELIQNTINSGISFPPFIVTTGGMKK